MSKKRIVLAIIGAGLIYLLVSINLVRFKPYYITSREEATIPTLLKHFVKDTSYIEYYRPEKIRTKINGIGPYPLYNVAYRYSSLWQLEKGIYNFTMNDYTYSIDEHAEILSVQQWLPNKDRIDVEVTPELKVKFEEDFYKFMAPILEDDIEPFPNLQWLFDILNPRE